MEQEKLLNLSKEEIIKRIEERYNKDILSIIDNIGLDEFMESCKNNYWGVFCLFSKEQFYWTYKDRVYQRYYK